MKRLQSYDIMYLVIFMRLKCVKGAKEKVESCPYIVLDYENYKGSYSELFGNDNPICVEIGMGKGNFIIENAKRYPYINFIGIEKYDSVIVRAVEKLENVSLPNLKLIRMDALNIENVFDHEVDTIYQNFSDPWPKARHARRRLTSYEFLKRYDNLFKERCHIIQKTDNRKLFEYSIKSLTDYGYKIDDISLNLYDDDISLNIQTEYEEKMLGKDMIIYRIEVTKQFT